MPDPDPRDEVLWAAKALRGISDLINEVAEGKTQFTIIGPSELGELLLMVEQRLTAASERIAHYQPRR